MPVPRPLSRSGPGRQAASHPQPASDPKDTVVSHPGRHPHPVAVLQHRDQVLPGEAESLAQLRGAVLPLSLHFDPQESDEFLHRTFREPPPLGDLDHLVPVPKGVPWFPQDLDHWTLRWVLLHLIEEIARHAGHADIVRESIDGATMFALQAGAEGWPATEWLEPWTPEQAASR